MINPQLPEVFNFLDNVIAQLDRARWVTAYDHSYPQWAKCGDRAWGKYRMGGTYQLFALVWYHHFCRPGSLEFRPKIVMTALYKSVDAIRLTETTRGDRHE